MRGNYPEFSHQKVAKYLFKVLAFYSCLQSSKVLSFFQTLPFSKQVKFSSNFENSNAFRNSVPATIRVNTLPEKENGNVGCESHIESIKSYNFGGMVKSGSDLEDDEEIVITLATKHPNLVAVTGETGSGKSLLFVKIIDLVVGGKVSQTMLPPTPGKVSYAYGEIALKLSEPHITQVMEKMKESSIDTKILEDDNDNFGMKRLVLKRNISCDFSVRTDGEENKHRLRSTCELNNKQISLKQLRSIASPLIAIVDASKASTALSNLQSRLNIIDTGVLPSVLAKAQVTMIQYWKNRKTREDLESELKNRILPSSFTSNLDSTEKEIDLMQHWVDELNAFETRMISLQDSISCSLQANLFLKNDSIDNSNTKMAKTFADTLHNFCSTSWRILQSNDEVVEYSFYENLMELRDSIKTLDSQLQSAHSASEALSSLSSQSVSVSLETARKFLFEAANANGNHDVNGQDSLAKAAERSHELFNTLENILNECTHSIEDDANGLIPVLEDIRRSVDVSMDEIDCIIADWGSLSRKHGITPGSLPLCHHALLDELEGNVGAYSLLPNAKAAETKALKYFEAACKDLSKERDLVCKNISKSVTDRLPSLGMENSMLKVILSRSAYECTDGVILGQGSRLGTDAVDFHLVHKFDKETDGRGGKLEVLGSSGEKARILLALETDLPGSVGASCRIDSSSKEQNRESSLTFVPPVAVLYDEIDAHVGGKAVVSIASLLSDQTRINMSKPHQKLSTGQVISITHNPAVAAVADCHIMIRKSNNYSKLGRSFVNADCVSGDSRRKELARMVSGDLIPEEAGRFADALLKWGHSQKLLKEIIT